MGCWVMVMFRDFDCSKAKRVPYCKKKKEKWLDFGRDPEADLCPLTVYSLVPSLIEFSLPSFHWVMEIVGLIAQLKKLFPPCHFFQCCHLLPPVSHFPSSQALEYRTIPFSHRNLGHCTRSAPLEALRLIQRPVGLHLGPPGFCGLPKSTAVKSCLS